MPNEKAGSDLAQTAALICFSDTHQNHVYGLGQPVVRKADGDEVRANPIRRELWGLWGQFWDEAFKLTDGLPRVAVGVGDLVESDAKVRSPQDLVSLNPEDVFTQVTETLDPLYSECERVLTIRGTEAHTGRGAWQEERIAANYTHSIKDEKHNNASWWHFYGMFGGVYFDIAHHASMGSIKRNLAGAAGRLAYDVREAYVMDWGARPPDLVLRAHNHRFADSGLTFPTRAVMMGCFQFKSTFVHRINRAYEMPNLGGLVIICDRGKYELHPIRVKPKRIVAWRP